MNQNMLNAILATQSYYGETDMMDRTIQRIAKDLGATVVMDKGNVYVTKGKASVYPCVVAHTDTVHQIVPQKQYRVRYSKGRYFAFNHVKGEQTGIGGDDKVGIFIALSVLERFPAVKLAFFRDEEIGCLGSNEADMAFFNDVAFVLQADRQGNDDFVKSIYGTALYGKEFAKAIAPYLKKHGYSESTGAFTDVVTLKEQYLPVATANMSCGYYHPHTRYEYIQVRDMRRCLDLVSDLVKNLGDRKWEHDHEPYSAVTYINGRAYTSNKDWKRKGSNKNWWDDIDSTSSYGTTVPYGSANRSDLIVLPDGAVATKLPDGTILRRFLGTMDQEVETVDATFNNPDAIVCLKCDSDMHIEYDDTVGLYFCNKCMDYVFPSDEEDSVSETFDTDLAQMSDDELDTMIDAMKQKMEIANPYKDRLSVVPF